MTYLTLQLTKADLTHTAATQTELPHTAATQAEPPHTLQDGDHHNTQVRCVLFCVPRLYKSRVDHLGPDITPHCLAETPPTHKHY